MDGFHAVWSPMWCRRRVLPRGTPTGWAGTAWRAARAAQPDLPGLPDEVAAITDTPRKYGFHGTVKPPFRLADGTDAAGPRQRPRAPFVPRAGPVDESRRSRDPPPRRFRRGGPGQAIRGAGRSLAAAIGRGAGPFRAPPYRGRAGAPPQGGASPPGKRRLRLAGATPSVMEEFRFHLPSPASCPAPEARSDPATSSAAHLAPVLARALRDRQPLPEWARTRTACSTSSMLPPFGVKCRSADLRDGAGRSGPGIVDLATPQPLGKGHRFGAGPDAGHSRFRLSRPPRQGPSARTSRAAPAVMCINAARETPRRATQHAGATGSLSASCLARKHILASRGMPLEHRPCVLPMQREIAAPRLGPRKA